MWENVLEERERDAGGQGARGESLSRTQRGSRAASHASGRCRVSGRCG